MRFPCFSAILRYGCLAILGLAAVFLSAIVFSSPAVAQVGDGNENDTYAWDTDNLVFSGFTARSFAVPHYSQNNSDPVKTGTRTGYSSLGFSFTVTENLSPCQAYVIDGFFQNLASQPRNDLPVLKKTDGVWGISDGNICDVFVTAQDNAISRAAANGGYWLDSAGILRKGGFGTWMGATRDASAAIGYTTWANKGSGYQGVTLTSCIGILCYDVSVAQVTAPSAADEGYIARIDYGGTGGRTVGVGIPSGGFSLPTSPVRSGWVVSGSSPKVFRTTWLASYAYRRHLSGARSVGGSHAGSWCPSGLHPRGEDAQWKIGSGTGRTLSSLYRASQVRIADLFWCRSDVRYPIWYAPQRVTGRTCGTAGAPACPAGITIPTSDFRAWGRVNCYYSALSVTASGDCEYPHPVPQCTDRGAKRDFTEAELGAHTVGAAFGAAGDGSTACSTATPTQAGFEADPCVTASLEIFESRATGSDAAPGVVSSDRTLAVAADRTAWDLDVMSAHPVTASPPRDTGDASGCADGSESRADHSSVSGGAARKQNPAPSYAASDRTDTAVPPNSAGGNIDYSGAARNMAHRYAGRVAENTCSVKPQEAEAELALLEIREAAFTQWLSDYKTVSDGNARAMRNYSRVAVQTGTGLNVLRFNDSE